MYLSRYFILCGVCLLLSPAYSLADFTQDIEASRKIAEGFGTKATMVAYIAIAIAFFGATASALQPVGKRWSKILTVLLGIMITGLIAVQDNIFDNSRHGYKQKRLVAKRHLNQISLITNQYAGQTIPDEQAIDIIGHLEAIDRLDAGPGIADNGNDTADAEKIGNVTFPLIGTAHATDGNSKPWWLRTHYSVGGTYYFTGKGADQSLNKARAKALANAQQTMLAQLLEQKMNPQQKSRYSRFYINSARIVRKHYTRRQNTHYEFYVQISLHKRTQVRIRKYLQ